MDGKRATDLKLFCQLERTQIRVRVEQITLQPT